MQRILTDRQKLSLHGKLKALGMGYSKKNSEMCWNNDQMVEMDVYIKIQMHVYALSHVIRGLFFFWFHTYSSDIVTCRIAFKYRNLFDIVIINVSWNIAYTAFLCMFQNARPNLRFILCYKRPKTFNTVHKSLPLVKTSTIVFYDDVISSSTLAKQVFLLLWR